MSRDKEREALFGAISLCKKAGALVSGFDAVRQVLQNGQAELLFVAKDLSPKTQKKLLAAKPPHLSLRELPFGQDELAAIEHKAVGILAVTDANLANLCLSKWQANIDDIRPIEEEPMQ